MEGADMSKKRSFWATLIVSLMMVLFLPLAVRGAEETPEGLVKARNGRYCYYENGKKVKKAWREVDGKKYYFLSTGWATSHSVQLNGKVYVFKANSQLHQPRAKSIFRSQGYSYYVNPDGTAETGWLIIKNKLYKAYSKSGRLAVNAKDNDITFGADGAAVSNTASKLKIRTMQIVSKITNSKMSKSEKLRACWRYVVSSGNFRYWSTSPNIYKRGWQKEFALSMLTSYRGSCSSFACAFAALAAEVGYTPYVISGRVPGSRDGAADGMTRHCWVKIGGLHYDPEGTWAGWAGYVYGTSYYPVYHTIRQTINFNTYV